MKAKTAFKKLEPFDKFLACGCRYTVGHYRNCKESAEKN